MDLPELAPGCIGVRLLRLRDCNLRRPFGEVAISHQHLGNMLVPINCDHGICLPERMANAPATMRCFVLTDGALRSDGVRMCKLPASR